MAVQGLNALLKKMELVPQRVLEAARTALEQNAEEIVAMMRRLVPRDTGDLARSIGWTWGDSPAGSITLGTVKGSGAGYAGMAITIYAGGSETKITHNTAALKVRSLDHIKKGAVELKMRAAVEGNYAFFQEFGTKNMPASPFFFPSYRALKGKAKARVTRAVRKAVKLG